MKAEDYGVEMDKDKRIGIVFNIKCYHPREDKEYQCGVIIGDDSEYQGWECPWLGARKTFRHPLDGLFRLGNILSRPKSLFQNGVYTQEAVLRNRHNHEIKS